LFTILHGIANRQKLKIKKVSKLTGSSSTYRATFTLQSVLRYLSLTTVP